MHCPTQSCILACLTALSQGYRDKLLTATLTTPVPILHRLCWVEDIINGGSKPHGHCCDLWASLLWQEVAVDRGQVEAMLDNTWRPAHEQPPFINDGKRMIQCPVPQSQLKLNVLLLMQLSKPFLLCEHIKDSLSELLTPLTSKTKQTTNFLCLQYPVLSMPFILDLTNIWMTEQHPAAGIMLGGSGSFTLTVISAFLQPDFQCSGI